MNEQLKKKRKEVKAYFGEAKHEVRAFCFRGNMCIDVEYEDFLPLSAVETDIREIIGSECLLNVKRELSDSVINKVSMQVKHVFYDIIDNYDIQRACFY